jgi:hypothetical protein
MGVLLILLLLWSTLLCGKDAATDWTWVHKKQFTHPIHASNTDQKVLLFAKENVQPFTQLVFSWNIIRPTHGYFSFYVQVRDADTKKWGTWHHMADWGKGIQHSYTSKSDGFSSYIYVRLETDDKKLADAFRVKIEQQQSAPLSLVHSIAVALSNFSLFKPECVADGDLPSVHVTNVPTVAQFALEHEDKGRICSPVSCSMMTHYLTGVYKDPLDFAAGVFDTGLGVYGSWACNVAHAFEHGEGKIHFFVRRMNGFADLHQLLLKGFPVVVSVRGVLPGAFKPFPHGHLMVVVGWDNDTRHVLCHDPASDNHALVVKRYPLEHFLSAWESSHRLAYVAEPTLR